MKMNLEIQLWLENTNTVIIYVGETSTEGILYLPPPPPRDLTI